ncbi:MAG: GNVR domain-containing protein, partial [Chlamydiota bacterium]|nr:GNVR domain-containing protein [Chlamydiota bacterium]
FLPNIYKSSTTVLVEDKGFLKRAMANVSLPIDMQDKLNIMRTSILSWANISKIIKELGMDMEERVENDVQFEKFVNATMRKVGISYKGRSGQYGIIEISFEGKNPETIQKFVNTMTQRYIEQQLEQQRNETFGTIDFIKQLAEQYKQNIITLEHKVVDHKNQVLGMGLSSASFSSIGKDLENYQDVYSRLSMQLEAAKQAKRTLEKQMQGEAELVVSQTETNLNPVAMQLQTEINNMQDKYDTLSFKYTKEHPTMIEFDELIQKKKSRFQELKDQPVGGKEVQSQNPIYMALKQQQKQLEVEVSTIDSRRQGVLKLMSEREKMIREAIKQEQELRSLTRDSSVDTTIYKTLRLRLENARITQNIEFGQKGTRFEMLDPARLPLIPIKPNRVKLTIMGLVLGLAVGGGLVIVIEQNDKTVKVASDVLIYFNDVPLLGVVHGYQTLNEIRANYRKITIKAACFFLALLVTGVFLSVFRLKVYELISTFAL